jgi:membrane protein DedA with SNARE-associated domain
MSTGRVISAILALAAVLFVVRRRSRLSLERAGALLLLAALLAVYASGVLPPLPDAKTIITHVANALGSWTYALVGVFAFLETGAFVGLVAPGETVVLIGGVIAGQGRIEVLPLIGLVWLCAALGDSLSFLIGRRLGRGFLLRHGPKVRLTRDRLGQVEGYFERHGGKTILVGRFIGIVRPVAPFIAGSSGMRYTAFIPYSVLGTGLWAALYCLLGYIFYRSFDTVAKVAGQATLGFAVVVVVVVGAVYAYRRLRHEEERRRLRAWLERQGRRPALRPVVAAGRPIVLRVVIPVSRAVSPRLRFLGQRLTPGGLGLEFTTALAVAAAGFYVFVLYIVLLAGHPGATPLDTQLLDLSDRLRSSAGVDAAKAITTLGSFPSAAVAVVVAALVLAGSGHRTDAVALLAGLVAVAVGVHVAKAGVDRPRPFHPLVHTNDESFPSGHAAYSIAWVAIAVAAWRALARLKSRAVLVAAALVLSAAIGLTRIYLRAHYWSDVAGGWGLGAGTFALFAMVGLVVVHIRHNSPTGGDARAPAEPR